MHIGQLDRRQFASLFKAVQGSVVAVFFQSAVAGAQIDMGRVDAIAGEQTAFAYSGDIGLASITEAANTVAAIGRAGQSASVAVNGKTVHPALYTAADPLASISDDAKIALLREAERIARARDPRVTQVMVNLACEHVVMLVMRTDGVIAADVRPLCRLNVSAIVESNGKREQGRSGGGGRYGFERFDSEFITKRAHEAVDMAILNLDARPAPAGVMPSDRGGTALRPFFSRHGLLRPPRLPSFFFP